MFFPIFINLYLTSFSIGPKKGIFSWTGKLSFKFICWRYYDKMIILVRFIVKNYGNFFTYTIFWITYVICITSIFSCIMTMISNFIICLAYIYISISIVKIFFTVISYKSFHMISAACLLTTSFYFFIKLITSVSY